MLDDPNTWLIDDGYEHRIYLDEKLETYAVVDAEDYSTLARYRWNALRWKGLTYARRAVGVNIGGLRIHTYSVYLHVEVMKMTGIERPTPAHKLVDHKDGDTLNCRRKNLRWATPSMNRRNIRGSFLQDFLNKEN